MKHLILTGACYVDTILDVPYFPGEDDKLRATTAQVRRGGNCPNSIEVLQQLLKQKRQSDKNEDDVPRTHLIAVLPARDASATAMIAESFGPSSGDASPNLNFCLYRPGHSTPASSYIIRSAATGSRTIVNHYGLPEMEAGEFQEAAKRFFESYQTSTEDSSLWHFEGRIPETTLACVNYLRSERSSGNGTGKDITVSVEVEKPGREGLRELAAVANVVFFSKSWAEVSHARPH
ncbi:hypothetical protein SBRCBS47491_000989 [Sporothrix bragantina]|uniref:Ketohexokinase n=1 Tax=Sporothrix bragantina TaxID=671064 RepID=A0ABP0AUW1_9PEZI